MRFAALGSGSRGNATLIEAGSTRVLLDCGFSLRELHQRLALLGIEPESIAAVVVTHEHGDHIGGVARFAARYGLPVWVTPGTWRAAGSPAGIDTRLFFGHGRGFTIGDLRFLPYPIPHDAREPCQFVIDGDGARLGLLTDAGTLTRCIRERLKDCDALVLEANHDPGMLARGAYPPRLRARVGGAFGHLSNGQAAELLDGLEHRRLRHLMLAHISANNNTHCLVREAVGAVSQALARRMTLAPQDDCSAWLSL